MFRKELEFYRLQPGQDLNCHLDLLQHAIERWLNIQFMESKLLELDSTPTHHTTTLAGTVNLSASKFVLDHPEIAYNNSYDMTKVDILAHGSPSPVTKIPLSEAKRFTIYSNSVKPNPRFKRIIEEFHTKDESMRTVRSLLSAIKNFELYVKLRQISDYRRKVPKCELAKGSPILSNYSREKNLDLNEANKPAKEKTASSTYVTPDKFTGRSRTDSERSNAGDSFQPRDQGWRYTTLYESSFQQGS